MKKILALLMAIMLVLSLAACGGNEEETTSSVDETTAAAEETTEAALSEVEIVEKAEGVGPVKLSNSYLEVSIPEGYGYYIDDANNEAGEEQFQLIMQIKDSEGHRVGELLVNNRGGFESADEYADALISEFKDSTAVATLEESLNLGLFDIRRVSIDRSGMINHNYIGYYQLPDESLTYRNVRFEFEVNGYYIKDVPVEAFNETMSSVAFK